LTSPDRTLAAAIESRTPEIPPAIKEALLPAFFQPSNPPVIESKPKARKNPAARVVIALS
jgi:hypothetical protein